MLFICHPIIAFISCDSMDKNTNVPFYKLTRQEKIDLLKEKCSLDGADMKAISEGLPLGDAERLAENVIAIHDIPLGIATNFRINGKDYFVPMAIEESSVIAAASNGAKHALPGGFTAEWNGNITVGQIQLKLNNDDGDSDTAITSAKRKLSGKRMKKMIMKAANDVYPSIVKRGGALVTSSCL